MHRLDSMFQHIFTFAEEDQSSKLGQSEDHHVELPQTFGVSARAAPFGPFEFEHGCG